MIDILSLLGKVHNEDCFDTMAMLPDASIGIIVTSPPYMDKEIPASCSSYYEFLDRFVCEATRIARVTLMFNSSRRLPEICRRYTEDIQHVLIWDKVFTLPAFKYEPIFVMTCEKIWGRGRIYRDCLRYQIPRNKVHINQNPVELYEELLKFFPQHSPIYDPFMGSGTTAIAAERLGRRAWFGSEIDAEYCAAATARIEAARGS